MSFYLNSRLMTSFISDLTEERHQREQKSMNKRQYTRFDHHSGTMLELKLRNNNGEWLKTYAFIADESFGGLGVLAITHTPVAINQLCQVNMPGIGWIQGRIAWSKSLDDSVQEVGIKYTYS
jgi:hypothetical protein